MFIQQLWNSREKTFLAIDFEWSERNTSSCLEWGYAAVRCSHLDVSVVRILLLRDAVANILPLNSLGIWPPDPNDNYRWVSP